MMSNNKKRDIINKEYEEQIEREQKEA